jgi:signal transduction histidine kinase
MAKENFVLFLDDEENILNSVKRFFLSSSYGVVTTTSADEVFEILEKEKIKVLLSDQRMPQASGVEVLAKVRTKYPDIIRILFTGCTDSQAAEDAINISHAFRFINKPWNALELKAVVENAIEYYDLIVENRFLFESTLKQNEELKNLNAMLKTVCDKEKQITSTVSHELRTPLASIKGAIDLVVKEETGDLNNDQKKFLEKAKKNIDRLGRLVNDVLDLTKMESGKLEFNFKKHDISDLITDVIEIQMVVAQEKGLEIGSDVGKNLPEVEFDYDRLFQVLLNLMNNALKFTEKGSITISVKVADDIEGVIVSVIDSADPISEEDYQQLFEKFQQLNNAEENQTGGSGLGLAICKEIVSKHKGEIWVESKKDKQGNVFSFVLPLHQN